MIHGFLMLLIFGPIAVAFAWIAWEMWKDSREMKSHKRRWWWCHACEKWIPRGWDQPARSLQMVHDEYCDKPAPFRRSRNYKQPVRPWPDPPPDRVLRDDEVPAPPKRILSGRVTLLGNPGKEVTR